jgi:hypothetical protein
VSSVAIAPVYQVVAWQQSPQQQQQTCTLSVDGASLTLKLTVTYNPMAGYWLMAVADAYGNLLLDSIPLLTGQYPAGNALGQYAYLRIGSCCIVCASPNPTTDYPTANNLGNSWVMCWGNTPPQGG